MRLRIDMLEKQLNGYRDLNTKMESELKAANAMPDICEYFKKHFT